MSIDRLQKKLEKEEAFLDEIRVQCDEDWIDSILDETGQPDITYLAEFMEYIEEQEPDAIKFFVDQTQIPTKVIVQTVSAIKLLKSKLENKNA